MHSLQAGAKIKSNLDEAHILVGIKETPVNEVITSAVPAPATSQSNASWSARTHLMFSHTAKGQPYNTGLLSQFVSPTWMKSEPETGMPRLIDYELLTNDSDGRRTVGFGWFAGGMKFHPCSGFISFLTIYCGISRVCSGRSSRVSLGDGPRSP
jgi:alpha-aminoadipic semialdehyde synthase